MSYSRVSVERYVRCRPVCRAAAAGGGRSVAARRAACACTCACWRRARTPGPPQPRRRTSCASPRRVLRTQAMGQLEATLVTIRSEDESETLCDTVIEQFQ